jgi:outer membrane protein assembly factor BamA
MLFVGVFSSCAVKKYLKDDEILINKYKVSLSEKTPEIDHSTLRTFLKPISNKSFLGIRFQLGIYYKYHLREKKFSKWMVKNFSEPPVFYTKEDADKVSFRLKQYLNNIGFFNSDVQYTSVFGDKTVKLYYNIIPATPYRISEITYEIPDTLLKAFVFEGLDKALIKEGDIYNAYTFDDERDRITAQLRDVGYYYFNRNYIQYIVDSSFNDHKMTIVLKINNVKTIEAADPKEQIEKNHNRYFINRVDIIENFKPAVDFGYDTLKHIIHFWPDTTNYPYWFLYHDKMKIKAKAFNSSIKIKPGKPYSATDLQNSYRRLFNYRIIRTATISFDTANAGNSLHADKKYLNSRIQIQHANLNTFSAEMEGTNSSGDLGIRGNLIWLNKNIFHRADVLRVRLKGGFEAQTISAIEGGNTSTGIFNTFEAGIDGTLFFPRFLFPIRMERFNQRYAPQTNLSFGYSFQNRPYYSRNIFNIDIGYTWNQNQLIKHIVTPINLNYVNINRTPEFDEILEKEQNRRLIEQYSDHMIFGLKYSFIFNNQNLKSLRHFEYLRVNFESSGNLLYAFNSVANSNKTDKGFYQFLGVRYAQYLRLNFDYRHYYFLRKKTSSLVFRLVMGAAIPYGNSNEVPYEKGFYGGGANDMRGWEYRTLGPGEYSGSSDYERIGDIQLELNAEYRFTIYKFFKGGLFVDVGNIWTFNNDTITFIGGQFKFDTFYKQLAVDAGLGFRFDFQFFVFRIDAAIPLRDPALTGKRWRFEYLKFSDFRLNFGIGYPF